MSKMRLLDVIVYPGILAILAFKVFCIHLLHEHRV